MVIILNNQMNNVTMGSLQAVLTAPLTQIIIVQASTIVNSLSAIIFLFVEMESEKMENSVILDLDH